MSESQSVVSVAKVIKTIMFRKEPREGDVKGCPMLFDYKIDSSVFVSFLFMDVAGA